MDEITQSSDMTDDLTCGYYRRSQIRKVGLDLLQEQMLSEQLLRESGAAIVRINADDTIGAFSAGAELLFGYDELDLINRPARFLIPECLAHVDGLRGYLSNRSADVDQWDEPIQARRNDGSELLLTAEISQVNAVCGSPYMLVMFHDITRQKRAEQEHHKNRLNLERLVIELRDELRELKHDAEMERKAMERARLGIKQGLRGPLEKILHKVTTSLRVSQSEEHKGFARRFKFIEREGLKIQAILDEEARS